MKLVSLFLFSFIILSATPALSGRHGGRPGSPAPPNIVEPGPGPGNVGNRGPGCGPGVDRASCAQAGDADNVDASCDNCTSQCYGWSYDECMAGCKAKGCAN